MQLSDNEKRDIVKYIESGKPLPDKYRFLLFDDKREVELVWNGKTDEVTNTVLPFQVIEQVDEPRADKPEDTSAQLSFQHKDFDARGRQIQGWTNKLIWGDNKLILSSLKNGPLREEIEAQGGLKLIYIDPPFDVGADFSMNLEIGDETFTKKPNVLEELAYRDTWGKGSDSYVAMIYERLSLMRDLLSHDGKIVVHLGDKVAATVRLAMDEVFGLSNYRNTIIIPRGVKNVQAQFDDVRALSVGHDVLLFYSRSESTRIPKLTLPGAISQNGKWDTFWRGTDRPTMRYKIFDIQPKSGQWRWSEGRATSAKENYETFLKDHPGDLIDDYYAQKLSEGIDLDFLRVGSDQNIQYYVPPRDYKLASTLWTSVRTKGSETEYATEKHEELLEVVIKWLSKEGDIVADFFAGSGTTLAAAEMNGRKWIGTDLGKFAIHTIRKRVIDVQREMKKAGKDYRAFEILNLGKYERQHYIGINEGLREEEKRQQIAQKEKEFVALILGAYKAESIEGFKTFYGKKAARLVAIGPINLPVSRLFVEAVIAECLEKKITKVDVLAFEFEMGLFPNIQEEAKGKGIDLALKYIPRDVFDKRAIEKSQVIFHDVAYIEVKPIVKKGAVSIELTDFSVFYNQDSLNEAEENLKNGGKKLIVENGQIIKVSKDKNGIVEREMLTKKWTDWIDYWAIDFNYESKKEIIRVKNEETGAFDETWTGSHVFENEWQSFRTKKDRSLELTSIAKELPKGKHKIAIKVVDIFGNDTMKIIELSV